MAHIWLRDDANQPSEKRTPLTPEHAKMLIAAGHQVTVERWRDRIFPDAEYEAVGCKMVSGGSWRTDAPPDAYILGIKRIPEAELLSADFPLRGNHIFFDHSYKDQGLAGPKLNRWEQGAWNYGGEPGSPTLYDLEFLVDENGKRVSAFGESAGYAGAAIGLRIWCLKELAQEPPFTIPQFFNSKEDLLADLRKLLEEVGKKPSAVIIGANGRCGRGAAALFRDLDIQPASWGRKETETQGPFMELLGYNIFCNCIFNNDASIRPFINDALITAARGSRELSVISDVTCDIGPKSAIQFAAYEDSTTFDNPTLQVAGGITITSIDHTPTHIPLEASRDFSAQLFPHLRDLLNQGPDASPVWAKAKQTFLQHTDAPGAIKHLGQCLFKQHFDPATHTLDAEAARNTVRQWLEQNPLTPGEQARFHYYLASGAEVISSFRHNAGATLQDQFNAFSQAVKAIDIMEMSSDPAMQQHHALRDWHIGFRNSDLFSGLVENNPEARAAYFQAYAAAKDMIDSKLGVDGKLNAALAETLQHTSGSAGYRNALLSQTLEGIKAFASPEKRRVG